MGAGFAQAGEHDLVWQIDHHLQVAQVVQGDGWAAGPNLTVIVHQFTTNDAVKRGSQLGVFQPSGRFFRLVAGQIVFGGNGVQVASGDGLALVEDGGGALIIILGVFQLQPGRFQSGSGVACVKSGQQVALANLVTLFDPNLGQHAADPKGQVGPLGGTNDTIKVQLFTSAGDHDFGQCRLYDDFRRLLHCFFSATSEQKCGQGNACGQSGDFHR